MNQEAGEDYRTKGYAHLRSLLPREICNAVLARMKVDLNRQGISLDKIEREGPLLRQKAPELYGYHYPMFTSFLWGMLDVRNVIAVSSFKRHLSSPLSASPAVRV